MPTVAACGKAGNRRRNRERAAAKCELGAPGRSSRDRVRGRYARTRHGTRHAARRGSRAECSLLIDVSAVGTALRQIAQHSDSSSHIDDTPRLRPVSLPGSEVSQPRLVERLHDDGTMRVPKCELRSRHTGVVGMQTPCVAVLFLGAGGPSGDRCPTRPPGPPRRIRTRRLERRHSAGSAVALYRASSLPEHRLRPRRSTLTLLHDAVYALTVERALLE